MSVSVLVWAFSCSMSVCNLTVCRPRGCFITDLGVFICFVLRGVQFKMVWWLSFVYHSGPRISSYSLFVYLSSSERGWLEGEGEVEAGGVEGSEGGEALWWEDLKESCRCVPHACLCRGCWNSSERQGVFPSTLYLLFRFTTVEAGFSSCCSFFFYLPSRRVSE